MNRLRAAVATMLAINLTLMTACGAVERTTPEGITDTTSKVLYDSTNITLYDEKPSRNYGIINGEVVFLEGVYGIRLSVSGDTLTISPYTHKPEKYIPDIIEFGSASANSWNAISLDNSKTVTKSAERDKAYTVSLRGLADGIYAVSCTFKPTESSETVYGWVHINNGKALTCRETSLPIGTVAKQETEWQEFIKNADPKDYLDETVCAYPNETPAYHHCREEIDEVADDLLKGHNNWTDEAKVLSFSLWLSTHIAYDRWRMKTKINRYENDRTIPDNFAMHNHVGICWDFSNILIIMCRHAGIPATSIDEMDRYHELVAVYVGGEWVSIDLANTCLYKCDTEDPDPKNWKQDRTDFTQHYGVHEAGDSLDYFVWKYK